MEDISCRLVIIEMGKQVIEDDINFTQELVVCSQLLASHMLLMVGSLDAFHFSFAGHNHDRIVKGFNTF